MSISVKTYAVSGNTAPVVEYRPAYVYRSESGSGFTMSVPAMAYIALSSDITLIADIEDARVLATELVRVVAEHDATYRVDLVKAVA